MRLDHKIDKEHKRERKRKLIESNKTLEQLRVHRKLSRHLRKAVRLGSRVAPGLLRRCDLEFYGEPL